MNAPKGAATKDVSGVDEGALVVVPREPDDAMRMAGGAAYEHSTEGSTWDDAANIYRAMVAAATLPPPSTGVLAIMRDGVADYEESGCGGLADDMRKAMRVVGDLIAYAESALGYVDAAADAERQRHRTNGAPSSLVVAQQVADGLRAALARVEGGVS